MPGHGARAVCQVNYAKGELGLGQVAFSCSEIILISLFGVVGNPPAGCVTGGQIVHGVSVSLCGGFLIPVNRFRVVLFHSLALAVGHGQVVLRYGKAFLGRLPVVVYR